MVDIIEHDDYNAPVNDTTIIEGKVVNPWKSQSFLTGKFFKIMPKIWVHLENYDFIKEHNSLRAGLLDENYYATDVDKSLYLKRVTIAFKRLNSIPTGKSLLEYLSKSMPLNPFCLETKILLHQNSTIINSKTKLGHPFNILIIPPKNYITNRLQFRRNNNIDKIKGHPLIGSSGILYYTPDVICAFKVNNTIVYSDPAVSLGHELIHGIHSILGLSDTYTLKEKSDDVIIEEKLTYGGDDFNSLQNHIKTITETLAENLVVTTDIINNSRNNPSIQEKFAEQFFLEKTTSRDSTPNRAGPSTETVKYIYKPDTSKYIVSKLYFELNETNLCRDFKIPNRETYGNKPKFFKQIELENPNHYSIKDGINIAKIGEMQLHKAFINFCQKVKDLPISIIYRRYRECVSPDSRYKRDLQDSQCKLGSRVKKSIECPTFDELINKYKSLTQILEEIPHKLLRNYSPDINLNTNKPKIRDKNLIDFENIKVPPFDNLEELQTISPEYMDTTPINIINNRINIGKCTTYEIDTLPHNPFIFPKDLLKSRALELPLKKDSPVIIDNKDFDSCVNCGTKTFTTSEELANKMDLLSKGKVLLRTGEKITNLYMFGIWLDEVIDDIKGTFPNKDILHKTNDFLSIVPYIGPALNIVVDIKDRNYVGAAETVGLLGLLAFFPELTFPVMLSGILLYLFNKHKNNINIQEQIKNYITQVLVENDYKIDNFFDYQYNTLSKIIEERVEKIASLVYEEFIYNVMGAMHTISYYIKKHNIINDEYGVKEVIYYKYSQLLEEYKYYYAQIAPRIYTLIRDKVIIPFQQQEIKYLSQIQQSIKELIVNTIHTKYSLVSQGVISDVLDKVDQHIKDFNIRERLKKEIHNLESFLNNKINSYNVKLPIIDMRIKKTSSKMATDINPFTTFNSLKRSLKFIEAQKCGLALMLKRESIFEFKNDELFNTTLKNDFTIGFWLRVPLIHSRHFNKDNEYTLLNNYNYKEGSGWKITFINRKLEFCYYKKCNNSFDILVRLKITNNINYSWNYITIINYSKSHTLEASVNRNETNIFKYNESILKNIFVNVGNNVSYQTWDFRIYIGGFKYYNSTERASDINDYDPLGIYDYYGNPIQTNKPYTLISLQKDPTNPNKLIYYPPYEDEVVGFARNTIVNYMKKLHQSSPSEWVTFYLPTYMPEDVRALVSEGNKVIMSFGNNFNTFYASNSETKETLKTTTGKKIDLYVRRLIYDKSEEEVQKVEVILGKHNFHTYTIEDMRLDNVVTIKMVPFKRFKDSRFIVGDIKDSEYREIKLVEIKEGKFFNLNDREFSEFFVLFPIRFKERNN